MTKNSTMIVGNLGWIRIVRSTRFSAFLLLIVTIIVASGVHGTSYGAGSLAYSSSSASAFSGVGNVQGVSGGHEGHKGTRSYNGGAAESNQPVKGGKGCPKCKWEDDDYWEKEEEETEPEEIDEDDCYDGDDGQYREPYGHVHESKKGLSPGIAKIGFTGPGSQVPAAADGNSANAGNNAGSSVSFNTTPLKQGHPVDAGRPSSGFPWNKVSLVPGAVSHGPDHGPDHPAGQQSGRNWNSDPGKAGQPGWNQGHDGSKPGSFGIAPQPSRTSNQNASPSPNTSRGSSMNTNTPSQSGGSRNNRVETGSGCSSSYQSDSNCGQGNGPVKQGPIELGTAVPAYVQKQGPSNYSRNSVGGYDSQRATIGCSSPYDNCGTKPVQQPESTSGQYPSDRSHQSPSSSFYGPQKKQGYSGSDSQLSAIDHGTNTSPHVGIPGRPGYSTKPSSPNAVGNSFSSSSAFAGTTNPVFGNRPAFGVAGNGVSASKPSYPSSVASNGVPFESARTPSFPSGSGYEASNKPDYSGVKGGHAKPVVGPNAQGNRPYHEDTSKGKSPLGMGTGSGSKNDDSKIFYINVNPAPGSPVGMKPHRGAGLGKSTHQPTPVGGAASTKPTFQPSPLGSDWGSTSKPAYRPSPFGGIGTTKPAYHPSPFVGAVTTKPAYQPSPFGGAGTTKSAHQPVPFGVAGTSDPAHQSVVYGESEPTKPSYSGGSFAVPSGSSGANYPLNQVPSGTGGCANGHRGCGNNQGGCNQSRSASGKPCEQQGSVTINKVSGPAGSIDAPPDDYSQSSQPVFPGESTQPPSSNAESDLSGCNRGVHSCAPGSESPAYVHKVETANQIPGGVAAGSYPWNPFLNGKIPNLDADSPFPSTTGKPIGFGNPFLNDMVQGAVPAFVGAGGGTRTGTWSHVNSGGLPDPLGGTSKPIGKGNPFFSETGPTRGDIGISLHGDADNRGTDKAAGGLGAGVDHFGTRGSNSYQPHPGPSLSSRPNARPTTAGGSTNPSGTVGEFGNLPGQAGSNVAGAFSNASSYAVSNVGPISDSPGSNAAFGQTSSGSWASSGAASQPGSGSWASSGATAYASSSANSWADAGPLALKG